MTAWMDFRALKHSIGMEAVLQHYGIRLKRVHRYYLRGRCPLPTHCSEQSRESFGVHIGNNVWACHSASCCQARQGKVGGTVLDLVAYMEVHDSGGSAATAGAMGFDNRRSHSKSTGFKRKQRRLQP